MIENVSVRREHICFGIKEWEKKGILASHIYASDQNLKLTNKMILCWRFMSHHMYVSPPISFILFLTVLDFLSLLFFIRSSVVVQTVVGF